VSQAIEAWPEAPAPAPSPEQPKAPEKPGRGGFSRRPRGDTITNTAKTAVGFREYFQYKELFYNLTLRELRSKYKRSVIGWGWSMINPLANMLVYTIVFSQLFKITAPVGIPSHLDSYALMYLSSMLPFMMWQGSIMESMDALLGNQNLIQKTWFPRELIPGATVASKLVSHVIEMSLLLVVIVAVGNWRALIFLPGIIATMTVITAFALGMSLLFSVANVFYRDIKHFSGILFFIWMFLTPVTYPFYLVGGGISGPPKLGTGVLRAARIVHLFGHSFNLGTLFKINPMTDAVLTMQSFIYGGSLPGTTHTVVFAGNTPPAATGYTCSATPSGMSCLIPSNVSWFDVFYFVAWAVALLVIGLWVFRKYEARLPEEL
jgi:lipopolysaccharide transport system permease protein